MRKNKYSTSGYDKLYYQKNKVKRLEYAKIRREKNREILNQQAKLYYQNNKENKKKYTKVYYKNNREHYIEMNLKRNYGITQIQYNELSNNQNNTCAICLLDEKGKDIRSGFLKKLAVDHNHKTGETRGLLCDKCNKGIGLFQDNPELLKSAVKYLENYKINK